jgi:hypothetical protein
MGGGMGAGGAPSNLNPKQAAVYEAFRVEGDATEEGATLDMIRHRTRAAGVSDGELGAIVTYLTLEGFIYSTVDEEHYRTTSS